MNKDKMLSRFEKHKGYSSNLFDNEQWREFDAFVAGAKMALEIAAEKARLKGERDCEYYESYRTEDDIISINEESILNCLK